jgi:hypothetical protein
MTVIGMLKPNRERLKFFVNRLRRTPFSFVWHISYFFSTKKKKKLTFLEILLYLPTWISDLNKLRWDARSKGVALNIKAAFPVPHNATENYVSINPHYFYQDIWVSQQMAAGKFQNCLDIGSRVDGFVSILLAMRMNLSLMDIRRPLVNWPQPVGFIRGDVANLVNGQLRDYDCISCLHVIEHIGLGKYGDLIDIEGPRNTAKSLHRAMGPGARLYISSPVSTHPGIVFNGGRHLALDEFESMFTSLGFSLINRAFVSDKPELLVNPALSSLGQIKYGCLILELQR